MALSKILHRLGRRVRGVPSGSDPIGQDETSTDHKSLASKRRHFPLGLETAPVIGALLLLASTCIPGSVIRDGIVGTEGVRPYDIMTLFISFVSAPSTTTLTLIPGVHFNLARLYRPASISSLPSRVVRLFIWRRTNPLRRLFRLFLPHGTDSRQ